MKVLIIGSGGRESAIGYALNKSKHVTKIYAIPGNPGMMEYAKVVNGSVEDLSFIEKFVLENDIDLTVIGPEVPLCMGLADVLEAKGKKVFGPLKKGAILEGSKAYAKDFMIRHNIPTANYYLGNSVEDTIKALDNFSYPVVVKADGLKAGKGVVICNNRDEAVLAINQNFESTIVLEEFLTGFECSLLCFTDSKTIVPMVYAKDHKQIYDNNQGPNTGGMGTVSPNPFMPNIDEDIKNEILSPFVKGLQEDNIDFRGVIFIGLMIENNKAKVLEFNVRFGDPETQSILLRLESDLYEVLDSVACGRLSDIEIRWKDQHAACLVLASEGYPGKYEKNKPITGLDQVKDVIIFHAGTALKDSVLVTNGGRVLNICALADTLDGALKKVNDAAKIIEFEGKYYRHDIGLV